MDAERRTKIATALQQYRETVLQHNFLLMRLVIEGVEAQAVPPNCPQEIADRLRIKELKDHYIRSIPKNITSPRDLLNDDVRADVISHYDLDGVSNLPVNLNERQEYFVGLRANIPESVEVAEFPPPDLEYLCTLVSAVTGPGLPCYRQHQQTNFISSIEELGMKVMTEYIFVPNRDSEGGEGDCPLMGLWEDWKIALAFGIGDGPQDAEWAGSYALYCRREDDEERKWRYGLHDDGWQSDVYDSVEEFLGFYAHCKEQTEEEVRKDELLSNNRVLGVVKFAPRKSG
ncbi:hypothetical protein LOCC1_G003723 [Lachnellula occidentalis]|uniref:Uncharacterized protein n=1 Tax=Lachnellula occidentalis TaxID=215460 RepID=A0A8H8S0C9_9HELO|nr:hypothetical protein LOCC1_G003723 [Lachnellula occidentalis]